MRLTDLEIVRVLELTRVIANLQPHCSLALLSPDNREQAIRNGWRRALLSCPKTFTELGNILRAAQ
jgi:hypothetical protein